MKKRREVFSLVLTGMFTAVLAVLSLIQIPMPTGVPITLQTFAVALCGYVLGAKRGAAAASLYVLLGLIGIPVYAGMTAGPGVLFGMTGGFLFGFVGMALICGLAAGSRRKAVGLALGMAGLAGCHILGCAQFSAVTGAGMETAFLSASFPYLVKDILSVGGAWAVGRAVRRGLYLAEIKQQKAV